PARPAMTIAISQKPTFVTTAAGEQNAIAQTLMLMRLPSVLCDNMDQGTFSTAIRNCPTASA
ncbi:hypothetical protein C1Y05_18095, partial [Pseudomonas sp. FW306-02-F04-BA]